MAIHARLSSPLLSCSSVSAAKEGIIKSAKQRNGVFWPEGTLGGRRRQLGVALLNITKAILWERNTSAPILLYGLV